MPPSAAPRPPSPVSGAVRRRASYRLAFEDGTTAVAYVWSPDGDLWDAGPGDPRDPFSHASGLTLFTAAADRLRHGRCPHAPAPACRPHPHPPPGGRGAGRGPSGRHPGGPAGRRPGRRTGGAGTDGGPSSPPCTPARARASGKVAVVDNGGSSYGSSCEELVVARALSDLDELPARDPRAAEAHPQLADAIRALGARVRPRDEPPALIHGELGGDHVRVTADGGPRPHRPRRPDVLRRRMGARLPPPALRPPLRRPAHRGSGRGPAVPLPPGHASSPSWRAPCASPRRRRLPRPRVHAGHRRTQPR
ncbi:hypothetical protein ACRAWF_32595 [Streptomyces sp. L7]